MSKTFKVGDVAIAQNLIHYSEDNGKEVEIIGPLQKRFWKSPRTGEIGSGMCYLVLWPDGNTTAQDPYTLRPKQPPRREQDEVVSWESVGWMPMDVKLDRAIKQALKDSIQERA